MTTETNESSVAEELRLLKQRADLMNIPYSNNIGVDTLRNKINERLESDALKNQAKSSRVALRGQLRKEQLKLVRIRLTVMNPNKAAWRGEFFTVANSVIGTVKKFVPFNPKFYTNGYHVPYCIYKMLKDRKFLSITTEEEKGKTRVTTQFVPEFSIEVLPQLTKEELKELATAQAAGNRID